MRWRTARGQTVTEVLMVVGLLTAITIGVLSVTYKPFQRSFRNAAECVLGDACEGNGSGPIIRPLPVAPTPPAYPIPVPIAGPSPNKTGAANPRFNDAGRSILDDLKYWIFPEKACPDARKSGDYNAIKVACGEYKDVPGVPFIKGDGDMCCIDPDDVEQGSLGDCYLIAAMMSVAQQNPALIDEAIVDNGDGTYTVRLYERDLFGRTKAVYVTVDGSFPQHGNDDVFAQRGDKKGGKAELWPMLIEKAYAQHKGSYSKLEGGFSGDAVELLTGKKADRYSPGQKDLSIEWLAAQHQAGAAITLGSLSNSAAKEHPLYATSRPDGQRLYAQHAYVVMGVDPQAKTVTIQNPWGWDKFLITLTWDEFRSAFSDLYVNELPKGQGCPANCG